MPSIFASLIKSDFLGTGDYGNLEAVIRVGDDLWHYFRGADGWRRGQAVRQGDVAFPGALIQSSMGTGDHGNFEVVVPVHLGDGVGLRHIVHFNDDVNSPWQASPQAVTQPGDLVTGPASLIQSDFKGGDHGNLELVVPLMGPRGHWELWHFFHDSANPGAPWGKAQRVTGENDVVTGPGSLIQSDYKGGDHGNFEVVVPLAGPNGHAELWHFFHDNSDVTRPWARARRVTGPADVVAGPGILLQGDFGDGEHRNFEVVVPIRMPHGHTELRHFWHGPDVETDWQPGQMITASASGWAAFCSSSFGLSRRPFEVLVEECHRPTIVHYWHDNDVAEYPWLRTGPLIDPPEVAPPRLLGEEPIAVLEGTRKIVQLTGEFDREGWGGPPDPPNLAHNRTESRWGVRGTDLGVSFPHRNRTYFLFGDTWRRPFVEEERDFDAIAFCTDPEPDDGLDLTFHPRPPIVPGIPQHGFEVPLDGVSFGGDMFVFFSTDRMKIGAADVMGRSIVAVSHNDGFDFTHLREFSRDKFINVSIEPVAGADIGLRDFGTALLIAGSGRYRSSDVYLAAMPLEEIASGRDVRFYAGQIRDQPFWSSSEADAVPLFCSGCVGELSLRWNRFVERWILLYNSDTPNGIVMRSAPKPWGEWSGPVSVFDGGIHGGYGKFMHIAWNAPNNPHDFTHDDMFTEGEWRENVTGGVYGPYQIAPLAKGRERSWTQLYFTMSTWNPYQVMLMTARLEFGGRELPGTLHDLLVGPRSEDEQIEVQRPGG
jgi:hypothetical protein